MILSKSDVKKTIDTILAFSKADGVSINISGGIFANNRFANNEITTCGESRKVELSITSSFGKRSGTVSLNRLENGVLRDAVREAERIAKLTPENPEFMPVLREQRYLTINAFSELTAQIDPRIRAEACESCIKPAIEKGLISAGYFENSAQFSALGTNKGLFGYHKTTTVSFTASARTQDGRGSGWAAQSSNLINNINPSQVSQNALRKAVQSAEPKIVDPGEYTVIFEPQAMGEFALFFLSIMDARMADEGRSPLSKPGGGNKIGEKVFETNVSLYSDPLDSAFVGKPFDADGLPAKKTVWIEGGFLKNLYYSRYWAATKDKEPTAYPSNVIMKGGDQKLEDLIGGTEKGLLITRLQYTNLVNPLTALITGVTRDGTFYIEKGKIKHAVRNLRFNETLFNALKNIEAMTPASAIYSSDFSTLFSAAFPAAKIKNFHFTSLSEAV